jgi:hypothetical protein
MIPVVLWFLVVVIWDAIIPLETVAGSTVNAFHFFKLFLKCVTARPAYVKLSKNRFVRAVIPVTVNQKFVGHLSGQTDVFSQQLMTSCHASYYIYTHTYEYNSPSIF